jgi:hypothetical protein
MKKKPASKSAFFNPRVLIGLAFCSIGLLLALLAFALYPGGNAFAQPDQSNVPGIEPQAAQEDVEAPVPPGPLGTTYPCIAGYPVVVLATAGNLGPLYYPDLASAIAAINEGAHEGAVTIDICASTTETGAMFLNSNGAGLASYTSVTIHPLNDGLTISGPTVAGRGLIELNGADNVTIDGDNPNTTGINLIEGQSKSTFSGYSTAWSITSKK